MTTKKKKVSVFTVNWNGKKWLGKYLKSIESQTYKNVEVIVVDNASTDGSIDFVRKNFPKVKIVKNKENFGLAKATKVGVNSSSGEYVLFINNDTWFEKHFIEKLVNFYEKNDYTVISATEKNYVDSREFKCNTTIDITGSPAYYTPTHSRPDKLFYLTVCFFCKKNDFLQTQGTDEDYFMYYEDVDWCWRLSLLGKKIMIVQDCILHHAGAGSTGKGLKYNIFLWRNQNLLQTLIKNYSLPTLILILPLYLLQNIFEIIFFLLILKPRISFSYIQGWYFNIKHLKRTLRKRNWVQSHRIVGDLEIMKKMYIGPAKLAQLLNYSKR